jgi:hypothetical protein
VALTTFLSNSIWNLGFRGILSVFHLTSFNHLTEIKESASGRNAGVLALHPGQDKPKPSSTSVPAKNAMIII